MKTKTYTMNNENEAIALLTYFGDCGITASRKGLNVKASGDATTLDYFYGRFVTLVLI